LIIRIVKIEIIDKIIDIKKILIRIVIKIIVIKYFIAAVRSQSAIICKNFKSRFLLIFRVSLSGQIMVKTFKNRIKRIIIRIAVTISVLRIEGEIRIEKFKYISLGRIKNI
jgi:hypothetical protein